MQMKTILNHSNGTLSLILLVMIALIVSSGCSKSKDTTSNPGANEVLIQSFAFTPSTITVPVNTTITWTNKDAAAHTVTSDNALFDSGNLNTNATFSHQFTATGTFNYHCTYHSSMLAKVIVQ
jgi:plastocyanin